MLGKTSQDCLVSQASSAPTGSYSAVVEDSREFVFLTTTQLLLLIGDHTSFQEVKAIEEG